MKSPTQRTKKLLEDWGYRVAICESWNSFTKTRHDLFGFLDLIAIKPGETVGVQCTSASGVAARRKKIFACESAKLWSNAGNKILLVGWGRFKRKLSKPRKTMNGRNTSYGRGYCVRPVIQTLTYSAVSECWALGNLNVTT